MAKKSHKQHSQSGKIQVGCMSGLIRMFDFRHRPKLLLDGNHCIGRHSARTDLKDSEGLNGTIAADNGKENGLEKIHGRPSIKALMEEEMGSSIQSVRQTPSGLFGVHSGGFKPVGLPEGSDIDLNLAATLIEIYKNHKEGRYISNLVESGPASNSIDSDNTSDAGNLDARLDQIPSSIQKALEDVAEAVISHQFADAKHVTSIGAARSKEFVDALQLLSSNKELFLMLLQDPNSRLLQCLQNLYTSLGTPRLELADSAEKTKLPDMASGLEQPEVSLRNMQRRHNTFLKEDKLVMRKPSKLNDSPQGLSRIVILKPSPGRSQNSLVTSSATSSPLSNGTTLHGQEGNDKSAHHFSLRELKRRLRLAISYNQKDHQWSSMDGALRRANSSKQLTVKNLPTILASADAFSENAAQLSVTEKETKPNDCGRLENDVSPGLQSFSYEEAKKHLIERLDNGAVDDSSQIVHKPESLGRLISFPEYDSLSTKKFITEEDVKLTDEATVSSPLQMIDQEDDSTNSSLSGQNLEMVSSDTNILDNEKLDETKPEQLDEIKIDCINAIFEECGISQKLIKEVNNVQVVLDKLPLCIEIETPIGSIKQENSDQCCMVEQQSVNALPETTSELPETSPDSSEDLVKEQEEPNPSTALESATPSVSALPCSPENTSEKEEQPSPLSVLDSFLGDNTSSSSHKTIKHDKLSMPGSRILFKELDTPLLSSTLRNRQHMNILDDKEARLLFVKAVLEALDLLSEDENLEKWHMDEPLVNPSIFAKVGVSYCLTDNAVFLIDCVEEILVEIRDKFFGINPWIAFLNHNMGPAPVGANLPTNLIQEVTKRVDLLVGDEIPSALDQTITKDLEGGLWMDLRCDSESIVVEVWDSVLDDLLEEMVFDLWL